MPWWLFGAGLLLAAAGGLAIGRGGLHLQQHGHAGSAAAGKSHERGDSPALLDERGRTEELLRPLFALAEEARWNPSVESQLWEKVRALDVAQVRAAMTNEPPYKLPTLLMARWAQLDPAAAMAFTEDKHINFFGTIVFDVWLKTDAAAALAWLQRQPVEDSSELNDSSVPACRYIYGDYLVETSPEKALQVAATMSREMQDAILLSLTNLDYKDEAGRRAVLELVEKCEEPVLKNEARRELFRQWFEADPDAAVQVLEGFDLPEEERESLRNGALYNWAARFDFRCEDWLVNQEGLCGSSIQKRLLWRHFGQLPGQVGNWLEERGATTEHYRQLADAARADGYMPGYSGADNVGTVEFISPLIAQWRKLDPAAADAWLEEAKQEKQKEEGP